jgi:hypothetical protein
LLSNSDTLNSLDKSIEGWCNVDQGTYGERTAVITFVAACAGYVISA